MKNPIAILRASIITVWSIAALAVGAELSAPLKTSLTSFAGQHWTGKSIVALAVFFISYAVLRHSSGQAIFSHTLALILSAILGGTAIFGFFVWHFFA